MTRDELVKLTKIRDDAKGSFWDFDKWRVMARLDQFIADAEHEMGLSPSKPLDQRVRESEGRQ